MDTIKLELTKKDSDTLLGALLRYEALLLKKGYEESANNVAAIYRIVRNAQEEARQ